MLKRLMLFAVLFLSSSVVSADDLLIDGSSATSVKNSINEMVKDLSDEEQMNFVVALMRIQFSDVESAYEVAGKKELQGLNLEIVGPKIDGLNYEEILELAEKSPTTAEIR